MIVDHIKNHARYTGCHKNIAAALQYIAEHADDPALETGTHVLVPDEVIVHVIEKDSQLRSNVKMEIHKKFMDIHYIIEGAERCGIAPLAENVDYDAATDNGFWDCEDSGSVRIGPGEFYAVWPLEPHCPLCAADGTPAPVRKIICKVKVD